MNSTSIYNDKQSNSLFNSSEIMTPHSHIDDVQANQIWLEQLKDLIDKPDNKQKIVDLAIANGIIMGLDLERQKIPISLEMLSQYYYEQEVTLENLIASIQSKDMEIVEPLLRHKDSLLEKSVYQNSNHYLSKLEIFLGKDEATQISRKINSQLIGVKQSCAAQIEYGLYSELELSAKEELFPSCWRMLNICTSASKNAQLNRFIGEEQLPVFAQNMLREEADASHREIADILFSDDIYAMDSLFFYPKQINSREKDIYELEQLITKLESTNVNGENESLLFKQGKVSHELINNATTIDQKIKQLEIKKNGILNEIDSLKKEQVELAEFVELSQKEEMGDPSHSRASALIKKYLDNKPIILDKSQVFTGRRIVSSMDKELLTQLSPQQWQEIELIGLLQATVAKDKIEASFYLEKELQAEKLKQPVKDLLIQLKNVELINDDISKNIDGILAAVNYSHNDVLARSWDFLRLKWDDSTECYYDQQTSNGTCVMHANNTVIANVTENRELQQTPFRLENLVTAELIITAQRELSYLLERIDNKESVSLKEIEATVDSIIFGEEKLYLSELVKLQKTGHFMTYEYSGDDDKKITSVSSNNLDMYNLAIFAEHGIVPKSTRDIDIMIVPFIANDDSFTVEQAITEMELDDCNAFLVGVDNAAGNAGHAIAFVQNPSGDWVWIDPHGVLEKISPSDAVLAMMPDKQPSNFVYDDPAKALFEHYTDWEINYIDFAPRIEI